MKSWERPRWIPGGGDALLFYVIFGEFKRQLQVSKERHRSKGLPTGVEARILNRADHADRFAGWLTSGIGELLRDQTDEVIRAAEQSLQAVYIHGRVPDPESLDYLRDSVGVVTAFLEAGGEAVLIPQALSWHSADSWKDRVFARREPEPHHHTSILVSEEREGTVWIHTRGLRQFGRPDLSIRSVRPEHRDAVIEMFDRFIEMMAMGGVIPDGERLKVDSLPEGMTCHHTGSLEDPDFNNVHVEIRWPED